MEHASSIHIFEDAEQLAAAAADKFVQVANKSLNERSSVSVALAGGTTPRRVYELLADEQFKRRIDWSRLHLFFGDERCVPPDHPESNYAMVNATLISKVPIPARYVHPIIGEGDPNESAEDYENDLRKFFPQLEWPRFDLVLLGMGDDGHTASLFPGTPTLAETSRWVTATRNERFGQDRITLTVPAFNHARHVIFLVTGKAKAQRLREVLRPQTAELLPAQLIKPVEGTLEWLVDSEAASLL